MDIPMTCPTCYDRIELFFIDKLINTAEKCPRCQASIKITISGFRPARRPPQPSREALAKVAA